MMTTRMYRLLAVILSWLMVAGASDQKAAPTCQGLHECDDGQCIDITNRQVCDGRPDCLDASDESRKHCSTKPPSIRMQPDETVYFKAGEEVRLNCIAESEPKPQYEWRKDGALFDPEDPKYVSSNPKMNRIVQLSGVGSLMMTEMVEEDAGIYQCFAKNPHGTSLSILVHLIQIVNDAFPTVHEPEKVSALLGDKLTLTCNLPKSVPQADFFWALSGDEQERFKDIEETDRLALDYEGNFHFANIKKEDQAKSKYLCMTWHKELRSYSEGEDKIIEIHGSVIGTFFTELMWASESNMLGLLGETVKMKCIFAGNPTPTIEWRRIGAALDADRMTVGKTGHELIIKDVTFADQGQYECFAKNVASVKEKKNDFTLRIEAKPFWVTEPLDVEAGVEENAHFACIADGNPTPTVEWFINGVPIAKVPGYDRSVRRGRISFTNLTKADSKVIQCNATNIHGSIWSDVYLNVLALPPNITTPPGNTKVAEGHDVLLKCENTGKPTPKIFWKKGDQKIESGKYVQLENGNLLVKQVTTADKGNYSCIAENRFGKRKAEGTLTVRTKTSIDKRPRSMDIEFDTLVQFRCSAITDPDERVNLFTTWLKDGQKIDLSDPNIEQRPEGTLIIKKASSKDTANYTCVVSNGLDSDNSTASLVVKAPPDPPTNVDVGTCEIKSGTVEWVPGRANFVPIKYFIVEYNNTYDNEWKTAVQTKKPVEFAKVKLSPYANYTFRVRGVNDLGIGEPSNTSSSVCRTNPARPDDNPKNPRTVEDTPEFLIIEWDRMEPIEHNGPDFKYDVEIERVRDGDKKKFVIDDYTVTRKEINVSANYEAYRIMVKAQNVMGMSLTPSVIFSGHSGEAKPLAYPTNFELQPNKTIQANSAAFQWDPVDTSPKVMRGKFGGYKIRYWQMGDEENKKEVLIPANKANRKKRAAKIKAVISSLPAYSSLEMDVVAVNTFFESDGSNVINVTTPQGVPGPVRSLIALYRSSNHFLLEWAEPNEINGIVTGYDIGFKEINGLEIGDYGDSLSFEDPLQRRASLQNLSPNQEYRLFVWARTIKGRGEGYYIDVRTTGLGPLALPKLEVSNFGEDYINVTWTFDRSDEQAPIGSKHQVKYRKQGGSEWIETPDRHLYQWQNISNLQPGATYELIMTSSDDQYNISSTRITFKLPGGAEEVVQSAVVTEGWFIGMMVALALLLLIVFIVCFIKRSRGDKYHVQEKERLRGTDPEANEQDPFNAYTKNGEEDPLTKSPDSFDNDMEKPPPESDIDSMAEYGDVDPSKFNEDGSFIGQYGAQKTPVTDVGGRETAGQPMSSFV